MNRRRLLAAACVVLTAALWPAAHAHAGDKRLAYLVSDSRIPFWDILRRGVAARAAQLGYTLETHSADNDARRELALAAQVIRDKVDGIVLSPTNSSAAVTVLKMAKAASIPVVIADIGSDGGEYVSVITSNNADGAYLLGQLLAKNLKARQWDAGSVGIIGIPQKRANGQQRTAGFTRAMTEAGITISGLRQQVDFSHQETRTLAGELIAANPGLRALWLQGSDRYQGALDAIAAAGKQGQILLVCFDAEPEFIDMIRKGTLAGAAMQQPFLMGEEATASLVAHLQGKPVRKEQLLPVLPVASDTITQQLPLIRRNVLGMSER